MDTLIAIIAGYLLGSIHFSAWLVRVLGHSDIRTVGDGNPGATNAWKAGGWQAGVPAMLLDFSKGALPVGAAYFYAGITGMGLIPVALAPVLGHAFSIFEHGRGGKALAVTFGAWAGFTLGEVPIILGTFFVIFVLLLDSNAWAVMLGMLGILGHLLLRDAPTVWLAIWLGNMVILIVKHRHELTSLPHLRLWRASA